TYTYWVDNPKFSGGAIGDLTGDELTKRGLYGVYTVAPKGSTFTDPLTGNRSDLGEAVNVSVPNGPDYRDFSLILSEDERQIGANFMPYPVEVERPEANLVNYRQAPRDDSRGDAFSSLVHGDPATPILKSYAGDKVIVNVLGAPGSEQMHAFNLGGFSFSTDPGIDGANMVQTKGVGPWELFSAPIDGGAGGRTHEPGDYFYGDLRRVFTRAGMWGLQRVLPQPANCPAADGAALICLGDGTSVPEPPPVQPPNPAPRPIPTLRQRSRAWVGTAAVFTGTARPGTDITFWYDSVRPGRPARRIAGTIADRGGDWRQPLRLRDSGWVWAVSRDGTSRKVLVNVYAQSALTAMSPARHRANFWVSSPAAPRGARFAVVVRNRAGVRVKTVRGIIGRRYTGVVRNVRIRSGWLVGTAVVRDPYHVEVRSTRHRFRVF
ncbi:MAG: hypothetical protein ACRDXB_01675, partial [Actinomycetes bacterium]